MSSKRIKAFTLLEVLFGMIISGIVISAAFAGYEMAMRQFLIYKGASGEIKESMQLRAVIAQDVFAAKEITLDEGVICSGKRRIQYVFQDAYVLRRENAQEDTFKVPVKDFHAYLSEKEQTHTGLIDRFVFDVRITGETESFVFAKEYGSEQFMKEDDFKNN